MMTNSSRTQLIVGIWLIAVVAVVGLSVALDARWSTTALLLVVAAAPMGVAVLLGFGGRALTTAELLYAIDKPRRNRR